jgi:carbon monoxide dehydrogenase subunit G
MPTISVTHHIDAAPDVVFDLCTDLDHFADRISGITACERLTDGPVGVGTRFRETRKMFGKEATEEMEFTAFQRPTFYQLSCDSCGAHYETDFRFSPEDGGTRIELEFRVTPVTFIAKLMTPLSMMMTGPLKKVLEKDLADIQTAAERGVDASASTA